MRVWGGGTSQGRWDKENQGGQARCEAQVSKGQARGERLRRILTETGRFGGKPTMLSCRSESSIIVGMEGGGLPTAAVESDHKLRGLEQHEFSASQFYINSPTWDSQD